MKYEGRRREYSRHNMIIYKVRISNIEEACELLKITEQLNGNVDLIYGSYIVDAKSTMGVISLVGDHILQLCIHEEITKEVELQLNTFGSKVSALYIQHQ